ncbi:unnamed protein product, partial [Prorocentrum cordatum]
MADAAAAGLELHLYPTRWEGKSGANPSGSVAREVRRNPKSPDFTGLERSAQSSFDDSGGPKTKEFDKCTAEQQKTNATVLKSLRQDLEKQENQKKRQASRNKGDGQLGADMHLASDATSRAPIQLERLKILQNDIVPKEVLGVWGADARRLLADPWGCIERRADDVEADGPPPRPRSDPRLRQSRELLKGLALTLHRGGLVAFGRVPNHWRRRPPRSRLAAPGAASALDLGDAALEQGAAAAMELRGAAVDLQDGFYQPCFKVTSDWFGLDCRMTDEEAGIAEMFGVGSWLPVAADDAVWPCFCGVPVGMRCERNLAEAQLLRDVRLAPRLAQGSPVAAPCADNGGLLCFDSEDANTFCDAMVAALTERGFRHAPRQLELRAGCAGEVMRIVLGHLVNFFMLARPALSVLSCLCGRSAENLGAQHCPAAFCSDACATGRAIDAGLFSGSKLRDVCQWRERWRFTDAEAMGAVEAGVPHPGVTGIVPSLPDGMSPLGAGGGCWSAPGRGARLAERGLRRYAVAGWRLGWGGCGGWRRVPQRTAVTPRAWARVGPKLPCLSDSSDSRAGLGCVGFTVKVFGLCHRVGVSVSIENPASSRLLKYPPLVSTMPLRRWAPGVESYTAVVSAFAAQAATDGAVHWFDAMVEREVTPNAISYNAVMDGFAKRGDVATVTSWLAKMAAASVQLTSVSLAIAVSASVNARDGVEAARRLQEMVEAGVEPGTMCYNVLISSCAKSSAAGKALHWFDSMIEKRISPDEVSYTGLIDCYAKRGDAENSVLWFHKMAEARISGSRIAYTAVIDCFARQGRAELAMKWLEDMSRARQSPDVISCNAVINGCAKRKDVQSAIRWLERMSAMVVAPNRVSYTSVIDACARSGRTDLAQRYLDQMVQAGHLPDAVAATAVIGACARGGREARGGDLASRLFER